MQPEPQEHQHTAAATIAAGEAANNATPAVFASVPQPQGHDSGGADATEDDHHDHSHDDIVADAINAAAAETYSMVTNQHQHHDQQTPHGHDQNQYHHHHHHQPDEGTDSSGTNVTAAATTTTTTPSSNEVTATGHVADADAAAAAVAVADALENVDVATDLSSLNIPHTGVVGTGTSTATAPSDAVTVLPPMNSNHSHQLYQHQHHQQQHGSDDQQHHSSAPVGEDQSLHAAHPHAGNVNSSHGADTKPPPISMQELAMSHLYPSSTKDSSTAAAKEQSSSSSSTGAPVLRPVPVPSPTPTPTPAPAGVLDCGQSGNTAAAVTTTATNKKDEGQEATASSSSKRSAASTTTSSENKKQKRARRVGKVPTVLNPYHAGFLVQRDNSGVNIAAGEGTPLSSATQAQAAVATGMLYSRGTPTMMSSFGDDSNAASPYDPNPSEMPPPQLHSQQDQNDARAMAPETAPIVQGGGDNVDVSNRQDSIQYSERSADQEAAVAAAVEAATSEIAAIDPSSTVDAMIGNDVSKNESAMTGNTHFSITTEGMIDQDHKPPIGSDDAFTATMPANNIGEMQYVNNPIGGGAESDGMNNPPFHHLSPTLGAGAPNHPDSITESGQVGSGGDVAGPGDDDGGKGSTSLSKHDMKWNFLFDKLLEFQKTNSHTMVPQVYKDDPNLGRWVHYQRVEYWLLMAEGKGKITPQRIARLNSIWFEWNPQKARWDLMFQRLMQFKAENGHCKVPKGYKKDKELANWVRNQRLERSNMLRGKKVRMTQERFLQLDVIGFKWSTPAEPRSKSTKPRANKNGGTGGDNSTDTSNVGKTVERTSDTPLSEQQTSMGKKINHDEASTSTIGQEIHPTVPEPEPERTNPSLDPGDNVNINTDVGESGDREIALEV